MKSKRNHVTVSKNLLVLAEKDVNSFWILKSVAYVNNNISLQLHDHITWIHEIATIPDGIWQQYEGPQMGF